MSEIYGRRGLLDSYQTAKKNRDDAVRVSEDGSNLTSGGILAHMLNQESIVVGPESMGTYVWRTLPPLPLHYAAELRRCCDCAPARLPPLLRHYCCC